MKTIRKLLLAVSSIIFIGSVVVALPLSVFIHQQSEKLGSQIRQWDKDCANKPSYDQACSKRRDALSGALGKFVALVNDELRFLTPDESTASDEFAEELRTRRKIMELYVRLAVYNLKCLGVPDGDAQCHTELEALLAEKGALYSENEHIVFDGLWQTVFAETPGTHSKNHRLGAVIPGEKEKRVIPASSETPMQDGSAEHPWILTSKPGGKRIKVYKDGKFIGTVRQEGTPSGEHN